ncbi:acyl-CoA dehydrogenase family protein [Nocardioides sp. MAHUQ-72]|uniref:acyl-CoA dehydrogenase family protein n=1 Tax=unclassified Nocardioides TaxID=2615069 RepID=UPI00361D5E5E
MSTHTDGTLLARFTPLFAEIAAGAVRRERERELPHAEVRALADAGFGRLRLPVEHGGWGASLAELVTLVSELATADSNIAHLWRGHFGFTELVLLWPDSPRRQAWLERIARGEMVGNATSETTGNTLADISSTVTEVDGRWLLNGTKFYSTGTLYSDWIYGAAGRATADGVERVTFAVRTTAPGITCVDDWDGFGQAHTASGTTHLVDVEVDPREIASYREAPLSHIQPFFQLYLMAVVAGIAQAVERDTVAFVRPRTRTYIHANTEVPGEDPQVLEVIGRVSADAFAARTLLAAAAVALEEAAATNVPGTGISRQVLESAENNVYQAQVLIIDLTLAAATRMFEVGGASATYRDLALDRHWRNARVVASHNPAIYKYRMVGERALHGRGPVESWTAYHSVGRTTFA